MTAARFHVFAEIDERAHYAFVQSVAEDGRLPRPTELIAWQPLAINDATWPRRSPRDPAAIGLTGRNYEAIQPPLYYVAAAPAFLLGGDHRGKVFAVRAFDLALMGLAVWLLWRLARAVGRDPRVALGGFAAALAVLLWPGLVVRGVTIGNTPLEVAVTAAFLLAVWRADRERRTGPLVLAAALLGLGLLTKLSLVALVPVWLLVLARRVAWDRARRAVPTALAVGVVPLLMLAPWLAVNEARYRAPTVDIQGTPGVVAPVGSAGVAERLGDLAAGNRRLADGVLPQELRGQLGVRWVRGAADALLLALLAAALALLLARGRTFRAWLLALPFVSGLVVVNATYVLTGNDEFLLRYLYPTLPPLALAAGLAAAASPRLRRALPYAVAAASVVALALWVDVAGAAYFTDLGDKLGI